MPSFKTSLAIAATTFFTFSARAQNTYNINPNSVPLTTRGMPPRLGSLACWLTFHSNMVQLTNRILSVALPAASRINVVCHARQYL